MGRRNCKLIIPTYCDSAVLVLINRNNLCVCQSRSLEVFYWDENWGKIGFSWVTGGEARVLGRGNNFSTHSWEVILQIRGMASTLAWLEHTNVWHSNETGDVSRGVSAALPVTVIRTLLPCPLLWSLRTLKDSPIAFGIKSKTEGIP